MTDFEYDQGGVSFLAMDVPFLRGDVNLDGRVTISDALMTRRYLFLGEELPCADAADADDDRTLNVTDVVKILVHLFVPDLGQSLIAAPYPEPGLDETPDPLVCGRYSVEAPELTDDLVRLGAIEAGPGEAVEIPIFISSDVDVEAYQLLIGYDPAVFSPPAGPLVLAGTLFEGHMGPASFHEVVPHPEEGLLSVGFAGSFVESGFEIPAGEDVLVGYIPGTVAASVPAGTEIVLRLSDLGTADVFKDLETELTYEGSARFVTVLPRVEDGLMRIVGDLTFFRRGDSNGDQLVDVSDPIFTLGYLFLGGQEPSCPDAADADDSGELNLTDAVVTLNWLFGTGPDRIAFPRRNSGRDPTPDSLEPCERSPEVAP